MIAAKRVMALSRTSGRGQIVKIPRVLAMVEDDLLVEIGQVVHKGKCEGRSAKGEAPRVTWRVMPSARTEHATRNTETCLADNVIRNITVLLLRAVSTNPGFEAVPNELVDFFPGRRIADAFDDFPREGVNEHAAGGLRADAAGPQIKDRFLV